MNAHSGRCMCGKVSLRIDGQPLVMYHCHCVTCRAASGASFATNVVFPFEALHVCTGAECIRSHESSPGKRRFFCGACGSPIYSRAEATHTLVSVRAGLLEADPGIRPSFHAYVASKAPWVTLDDDLPRYPQARP